MPGDDSFAKNCETKYFHTNFSRRNEASAVEATQALKWET